MRVLLHLAPSFPVMYISVYARWQGEGARFLSQIFLFFPSSFDRLEGLDKSPIPCYSSAYQIGRTFVRRIATKEVHRKKPTACRRSKTLRRFPREMRTVDGCGSGEVPPAGMPKVQRAPMGHESLRQKDRVKNSGIRFTGCLSACISGPNRSVCAVWLFSLPQFQETRREYNGMDRRTGWRG